MVESRANQVGTLKLFISYSRKDVDFARELLAGLEAAGFQAYLDQQDIAPGEDWEARLGRLIAGCDAIVFVLSPDAVQSERCGWEVEQAQRLAKRILPIVWRPVPDDSVPIPLKRLNYIFFDRAHSFGPALASLALALRTDLDWIREHTRLAEAAQRWKARGRLNALLLRGEDLAATQAWLARQPEFAPEPTFETIQFIDVSAAAEALRTSEERKRLDEIALAQAAREAALQKAEAETRARSEALQSSVRSQRRARMLLWAIATILVLASVWQLSRLRDTFLREAHVFTSVASKAFDEGYYDRAMRMALAGLPSRHGFDWLEPWHKPLVAELAKASQLNRLRLELRGHTRSINSLEFSLDATRLISASDDGTARIWDASTGVQLTALTANEEAIYLARYAPGGDLIVTGSEDGSVRLWKSDDGRLLRVLQGPPPDFSDPLWPLLSTFWRGRPWIAFSPDGSRLAAATIENTVKMWNLGSGQLEQVFTGHQDLVETVSFSSDGTMLLTGSHDRTARIWSLSTGAELRRLAGHQKPVTAALFDRSGQFVVTGSGDYFIRVWNLSTGDQVASAGSEGWIKSIIPLAEKDVVISVADQSDKVRLWKIPNLEELRPLLGHAGRITSIRAHANGEKIVTASADASIRVWDADEAFPSAVLRGHDRGVSAATFSPDGEFVASGAEDGVIRLWRAQEDSSFVKLDGSPELAGASFARNAALVVGIVNKNTIRVWDLSGRGVRTISSGEDELFVTDVFAMKAVAISPNGAYVATSAQNNVILVWSILDEGKSLRFQNPDANLPSRLAFHPKLPLLFSGSRDGTLAIWNVEKAERYAIWHIGHGPVSDIAFSDDGTKAIIASANAFIDVWDVGANSRLKSFEIGAPPSPALPHRAPVSRGADNPIKFYAADRVGFDALAQRFYAAPISGPIMIYEADSKLPRVLDDLALGPPVAISLLKTGRRLLVATSDAIRILDVENSSETVVLKYDESIEKPASIKARFGLGPRKMLTRLEDPLRGILDAVVDEERGKLGKYVRDKAEEHRYTGRA